MALIPNNTAAFTVRLANAIDVLASVDFETIAGTAAPDADYEAQSGTIEFAPGQTVHQLLVPIRAYSGPSKAFTIRLTNPVNCALTDFEGAMVVPGEAATVLFSDNFNAGQTEIQDRPPQVGGLWDGDGYPIPGVDSGALVTGLPEGYCRLTASFAPANRDGMVSYRVKFSDMVKREDANENGRVTMRLYADSGMSTVQAYVVMFENPSSPGVGPVIWLYSPDQVEHQVNYDFTGLTALNLELQWNPTTFMTRLLVNDAVLFEEVGGPADNIFHKLEVEVSGLSSCKVDDVEVDQYGTAGAAVIFADEFSHNGETPLAIAAHTPDVGPAWDDDSSIADQDYPMVKLANDALQLGLVESRWQSASVQFGGTAETGVLSLKATVLDYQADTHYTGGQFDMELFSMDGNAWLDVYLYITAGYVTIEGRGIRPGYPFYAPFDFEALGGAPLNLELRWDLDNKVGVALINNVEYVRVPVDLFEGPVDGIWMGQQRLPNVVVDKITVEALSAPLDFPAIPDSLIFMDQFTGDTASLEDKPAQVGSGAWSLMPTSPALEYGYNLLVLEGGNGTGGVRGGKFPIGSRMPTSGPVRVVVELMTTNLEGYFYLGVADTPSLAEAVTGAFLMVNCVTQSLQIVGHTDISEGFPLKAAWDFPFDKFLEMRFEIGSTLIEAYYITNGTVHKVGEWNIEAPINDASGFHLFLATVDGIRTDIGPIVIGSNERFAPNRGLSPPNRLVMDDWSDQGVGGEIFGRLPRSAAGDGTSNTWQNVSSTATGYPEVLAAEQLVVTSAAKEVSRFAIETAGIQGLPGPLLLTTRIRGIDTAASDAGSYFETGYLPGGAGDIGTYPGYYMRTNLKEGTIALVCPGGTASGPFDFSALSFPIDVQLSVNPNNGVVQGHVLEGAARYDVVALADAAFVPYSNGTADFRANGVAQLELQKISFRQSWEAEAMPASLMGLIYDSFTDIDGTFAFNHTGDSGVEWFMNTDAHDAADADQAGMVIKGNALATQAWNNGNTTMLPNVAVPPATPYYVEFGVTFAAGTGNSPNLVLNRASALSDAGISGADWMCQLLHATTPNMGLFYGNLAGGDELSMPDGVLQIIRCEFNGTNLVIKLNGAVVMTDTDAMYASLPGGYMGLTIEDRGASEAQMPVTYYKVAELV